MAERDIRWRPSSQVVGLDPDRKVATMAEGEEIPYDLFLGVPVHRAPAVVEASGLCVDGWIPVNPVTLETAAPGVYAVGDVTSVGTPKAGVFAEGQAETVASALIAQAGGPGPSSGYDGRGQCYLEFGHDEVARVDVTFAAGQAPVGSFETASRRLAEQKSAFGSARVRRWFDPPVVAVALMARPDPGRRPAWPGPGPRQGRAGRRRPASILSTCGSRPT